MGRSLEVFLQQLVYKSERGAGAVSDRVEALLDQASRSRRINRRNLPPELRARRDKAQAQIGTAAQREMRRLFQENPGAVTQALELPDLEALEQTFHAQARVTTEHDPYIPLGERTCGRVEFDPDDPRIIELQQKLPVEISPKMGVDKMGKSLMVYDWVRPERDDGRGRRLTGALESPTIDENGNLVYPAGWRAVMVPNVAGAMSRAALRWMAETLGEDLKNRRIAEIISGLDRIAETSERYLSPDQIAEIFSLARTHPSLSPHGVVETWSKKYTPILDPAQPSTVELRKKKWGIEKLWKRKRPIRVTRFKPRNS